MSEKQADTSDVVVDQMAVIFHHHNLAWMDWNLIRSMIAMLVMLILMVAVVVSILVIAVVLFWMMMVLLNEVDNQHFHHQFLVWIYYCY